MKRSPTIWIASLLGMASAAITGGAVQHYAASAPAEPATLQATITGPESVPIGKLATLTADVQGATVTRWYPVNPVYDHECQAGLTITGDRAETRRYALFVASATESLVVEHQVKIVADSPTPIPPDNPCPPPGPQPPGPTPPTPIPPGPAELTVKAREWLATVPAGSLGKKQAIADGVTGIVSAINRGSLATVGEVDQALRAALVAATKLDTGWLKFGTAYNAEIEARKADGRISTPAQYAAALSQIVEALQ